MKLFYRASLCVLMLGAVIGCATPEKAELGDQAPQEAISEVSELKEELLSQQIDLLAPKEFERGLSELKDAREGLESGKDAENILSDAAQAKAYFQNAQARANSHEQVPQRLLDERKAALDTGLRQATVLRNRLADIDEDLRDETDYFSKSLSPQEFSEFQQAYLDLEAEGVRQKELKTAELLIEKAESDNAKKKAPSTLTQAKTDYTIAANLINKNSRNPEAYQSAVEQADRSARLLSDVMAKIDEAGKNTSEKVALQLVAQDRRINNLSGNIDELRRDLAESQSDIETKEDELQQRQSELQQQQSQLEEATAKLNFQRMMNDVRQKFDEDEAEVYQQGNDLIIRLKSPNFSFASAELPAASMGILSKVNSVIEELSAERVVIQGHTDSTGPAEYNQQLSEERAEAVAQYFRSSNPSLNVEAVGYGDTRPLASNATKEGRAKNRRVDVVISTTKYMVSQVR